MVAGGRRRRSRGKKRVVMQEGERKEFKKKGETKPRK